ncbi:DUF262 domain-containing protein [Thioalkalivibrio sp. HK1]|uniref:DUF262 domain-containing protein n=1 Tax=Thioalkalivibrio sp. HK1 TaxID=1469245 RepID=UPI0004729714|nr:DUF262 domain-containing protein [Thioalkalivibrio sp. HK1]
MKAEIKSVEDILTHLGGKQYLIPPYQRPYVWDKDQAVELIRDIYDSCIEEQKEYYIGGLICIQNDNHFEVVDGQQRLITLTLILKELVKIIEDSDLRSELRRMYLYKDSLSENKLDRPVINVRDKEGKFYKDQMSNDAIVQKPEKDTDTEKVFRNNAGAISKFLEELKEKKSLSLRKLAAHLARKVYVVFVEVDDRESSFRMFHVLNHRGQPLSDADLIKNTLLEKVTSSVTDSQRVEENWKTIEENIGIDSIDAFLRLNASSEKKDRNRVKSKIYSYYTDRLKKNDHASSTAIEVSDSLAKSADLHSEILANDATSSRIMKFLEEIGTKDEWLPAFMAFRKKFSSATSYEFDQFIDLFQRAYVQAWLRDEHKSQRESVRYYAVEAINKEDASIESVMSCVRDLSVENNIKQPFDKVLDKSKFYDGSRPRIINLVKSILLKLDETYEDENVERNYKGRITIEHILPQKINNQDYWTTRFNEEEHQELCNTLGNLTLLSRRKNGIAQNSPFDKKKEAYEYSNRKSSFNMTKDLCLKSEWNLEALKKRHEELKAKAVDLWGIDPQ